MIMENHNQRISVFWGWHWPGGVKAIKTLEKEGAIKVAAWFGPAGECTHSIDEVVYQCKLGEAPFSGDANHISSIVSDGFITFLDMFSRIPLAQGKPVQELGHIFHLYIDFFSSLLIRNRVDVVFLQAPPVFGPDYVLYRVAKALRIKVVITYQSLFPNRFLYIENLDDFGVFDGIQPYEEAYDYDPTEDSRNGYFYIEQPKPVKHHCRASLIADLLKLTTSGRRKPNTLAGVFQKYQECRNFQKFQSQRELSEVDLDRPFVYFPLQLQPELTTSALGDGYADQLSAVEKVRELIPDDWLLYIKENPKQRYRQRGEYFYRRIDRIPGATLVSRGIDTYKLMEKARFTSVVTGTAGWESICSGRPVLVFGRPWYMSFPGVVKFREGLQLSEITETTVDPVELKETFRELTRKMFPGVVDPDYIEIVEGYSDGNNAVLLERFIKTVTGFA